MEKVQVSREIAEALDKLNKDNNDNWSKQFNLISHCSGYSGNGILCKNIYQDEYKVLANMQPLEFAKCLILGYEVAEDSIANK